MKDHKDRDREPTPISGDEDTVEDRSADTTAESVPDEISKLLADKQELMNTLVRRQADFENYRKRVEKERQQDRHRGVELLVEHILPVLDAFDRALAGENDAATSEYRKGFELIRRQLWEALAKQGLSRIESVGQEFNPHLHHAIESVETSEHSDGTVLGEMQSGYRFQDRVLRPAMVPYPSRPDTKSSHDTKREH